MGIDISLAFREQASDPLSNEKVSTRSQAQMHSQLIPLNLRSSAKDSDPPIAQK